MRAPASLSPGAESGLPRARPEARVAVVHLAARRYYMLPRTFYEANLLAGFYTDFFCKTMFSRGGFRVLESFGLDAFASFLNRFHPALANAPIKDYKVFGLISWWRRRRMPVSQRPMLYSRTNAAFNRRVIRSGIRDANVVYAFQSGALELFRDVGNRALKVLDQNLAPYRVIDRMMAREKEAWPYWCVEGGYPGANPLEERQREEWQLADVIVVPSAFVAESLKEEGVDAAKIEQVPYPTRLPVVTRPKETAGDQPLHVLFLGNIGLRKGVPYLLEAALQLGPQRIQVHLVGAVDVSTVALARYKNVAIFKGRVPRHAIGQEFEWADVLCLPSLGEGQALVTNEALARGVPVICTSKTGSRVLNGIDGTIVSERSVDALVRALARYATDRPFLEWQSKQAIERRDRLSYANYRDTLLNAVTRRFHNWHSKLPVSIDSMNY